MRKLPFPLAFLLAACGAGSKATPEIGRDLPAEYADGTRVFDQRVKQRFPLGSSEQAMVEELERQGFRRSAAFSGVEDATFTRDELITETLWSVRWRAQAGRITEIWGVYGVTAP